MFPRFSQHYAALLLATGVALACVTPFLYFACCSPDYAGVSMIGPDAEEHYLARIEEVYNGHPGLGNVFLADKDQSYFIPPLGEIVVASIGRALRISSSEVNLLTKAVFPFIATLLAYALALALSRSRAAALVGAGLVVIGDNLTSGSSAWLKLIAGQTPSASFPVYARAINPELSAILLFGALLLLFRCFVSTQKPKIYEAILLGLITGVSLYLSPFIASFMIVSITLCCLLSLYRRNSIQLKTGLVVFGVASVTCIPFLFNLVSLRASEYYGQASLLQGLRFSHAPIAIGLWLSIIVVLSLFIHKAKSHPGAASFFVTTALALILLINQQIITGASLQAGHYHWYITKPLAAILIGIYAAAVIRYLTKRAVLRAVIVFLIMAVLFYNVVLIDITSYRYQYPMAVAAQSYAPVIRFLETLPEQGVWADKDFSKYIPIYSHHQAPGNGQIGNYLVPRTFFENRLFIAYRLRGISPKDALKTMMKERAMVSSEIYSLYWREQTGSFEGIPDQEIERIAKEYAKRDNVTLAELFAKVGASIIVWNKQVEPNWQISDLSFVKKVFSSGEIEVYQIVPNHA